MLFSAHQSQIFAHFHGIMLRYFLIQEDMSSPNPLADGKNTALLLEFKTELKRCLLLSDEDRKYWLDNAETLPTIIIEGVLKVVKEKNGLMDKYMRIALQNDPNQTHLIELKTKIKQLKQTSLTIEEKVQTPNADEELERKLANL